MAIAPLKISYCTTCKGRLHHLRETLPANMAAEKNNPNVEFVVLDYGSEDGLAEWIKTHYWDEIQSGRLRYARTQADHFEMAHAKNMAHRLATGDVLCNVDADNFIAPNFSHWLTEQFTKQPESIVSQHSATVSEEARFKAGQVCRRLKERKVGSIGGTAGRVALRREDFLQLGGYDERYSQWGGDEVNLVMRARDKGITQVRLPNLQRGSCIEHSDAERYEHMSGENQEKSKKRLEAKLPERLARKFKILKQTYEPVANPSGSVGCGVVNINFATAPSEIEPLVNGHADAILPVAARVPSMLRADWAATQAVRHPQNGPRGR